MTAIGTRRPREGRCERCGKPLTDEEWCGSDWDWADPRPGECFGSYGCSGPSVDWRARALAAEADLADAESRGRAHGLLAAAMLAESTCEHADRRYRSIGSAYWDGATDETSGLLSDVLALAKETTDGR